MKLRGHPMLTVVAGALPLGVLLLTFVPGSQPLLVALLLGLSAVMVIVCRRLGELERGEQELRELISDTAREVMVPLTVLEAHLAEGESQMVAAREEAHYVAALVSNFGVAARLDGWEPRVDELRVDLSALLHRVADRHRGVANERDITIEVGAGHEQLFAMADEALLEHAVNNLAYNAVRHNREGGHVALIAEAKRGPAGESCFRIRVLDDGPGMPADIIARLMDRDIGKLSERRGEQTGQGLGLDVTKRAVEVQGFALTLTPGAEGGLEADIEGLAVA